MKRLAALFLAATLGIIPAGLAETALSALRALPRADAPNLLRVSSQDGSSTPGQWFFTVYDDNAPSHVRELGVVKGEVVTARDVPPAEAASQPKDVLVASDVKVDSTQAGDIALAYAAANRLKVGSLTYDLRRQGRQAVPVWIVQCQDSSDRPLGSVVVTASRGNVIASEGFSNEPAAATTVSDPIPSPAAGITPQVMRDDQQFLANQTGPVPSADVAATIEQPAPIASHTETKTTKSTRSTNKDRSLAPRVTITSRQVYTEPGDDDIIPRDDRRDRDENAAYERRYRYDEDSWSSDDEPRSSKIHRIRTFIHRLLPF